MINARENLNQQPVAGLPSCAISYSTGMGDGGDIKPGSGHHKGPPVGGVYRPWDIKLKTLQSRAGIPLKAGQPWATNLVRISL